MQLKIRRSQRDGGILSNTVIFCLDARVDFTADEQRHLVRYKLQNQAIYNSEASKRHLTKADTQRDGSTLGSLKSIVSVAMAAMKLNISIASLQRGQHVECKSLDELLGAEEAIMTACENLKQYLDIAATFDGREVLFDFATGAPTVVAESIAPAIALVAPPSQPVPLPLPPAVQPAALPPPIEPEAAPASDSMSTAASPDHPPPGVWSGLEYEQKRIVIIAGALVLYLILLQWMSR
jgi:hypothetical protein